MTPFVEAGASSQWLDALSTQECLEALGSRSLGRVGLSIEALPVILPVLYRVSERAIWFFTAEGSKLNAAVRSAVLAFEVDDWHGDQGWSVLVIGRSHEEEDPQIVQELRETGLAAGAPGIRDRLVCIPIEHISGRSFRPRDLRGGSLGYL